MVSCNDREEPSQFAGEWVSTPLPGFYITLVINAENEVHVNMYGAPSTWKGALSSRLRYIIEEDKMYPMFLDNPNQRDIYFLITMLSQNSMKLQYRGWAPGCTSFILSYVFDRIIK
jgi:hypothetical protein